MCVDVLNLDRKPLLKDVQNQLNIKLNYVATSMNVEWDGN